MLALDNVAHAYGRQSILKDVSFQLEAGEIGCLLGPSGCGKTTVLRLISGFERLQTGSIRIGRELVASVAQQLPPNKRQVGIVFQDYALFPHLDVASNVAFGLDHLAKSARTQRVSEMLTLTGLAAESRRYPHELSGGQQQRVALARALAPKPSMLLLDEPFSNLDVELREKLSLEVRDILKHEGITALLVTHDQHEAFAIADVVGVMNGGVVQQWDSPYNLYHRPSNRFVADFVGQGAFLPGVVRASNQIETELGLLDGALATECDGGSCTLLDEGTKVDVLLRPDDILHDDTSTLMAQVERKAFRGAQFLYTLRLSSGSQVYAQVPSHHNHALGEKIGIHLEINHVIAFRDTGQLRKC